MCRNRLVLGASIAAMLIANGANAGTLWIARLSQANENPPTGAPYTGTGFLVLNDAETSATVTATHNVPTNLLTGGHIHRGLPGTNGPIIFPFPSPLSPVGPLVWAIPTADVGNLKAGGLYMNFHTSVNPGGAIRSPLLRFLMAPAATNGAQLAVANALDVSAGYSADLDQFLQANAVASTAAQTQALDELSGRTLYADGREALGAMTDFQDTLFLQTAGAKGAGVSLFGTVGDTFGKWEGRSGQAGAKVSRPSFMAGFDYGLTDGAHAGLAVGYADGKDKFDNGAGETTAKTTSLNAFASTGGDGVVFTGIAGYGWSKLDTSRNLSGAARTAASSHDAKTWALAAKVSVPLSLGGDTKIAPYGQIDLQESTIDGYAETGAGSLGLRVPKQTVKSASAEIGAAVALPLSAEPGGLTARLQAGWRQRLNDGGDAFATSFAGSPVGFVTTVESPGRSAAHISASISGALAPNLTLSAGYRGLIGSHADAHMVQLRLALTL